MLNKMAKSEFSSDDFGKNECRRRPRFPPIFWSLKRALEILISVRMRPFATF